MLTQLNEPRVMASVLGLNKIMITSNFFSLTEFLNAMQNLF